MEEFTNSSSVLLGDVGWCLICCSAYPKSNCANNTSNLSDYSRNRLTKATETIFEYLLVPKENIVKVKKKESLLSFCPNCMLIVEQVIELQKKAEVLELQIKWKVETLGRIAIDSPAFTRNSGRDQKHVAEVWSTFKSHVTINFLQGSLPNPSARLEKTVNGEKSTVMQIGNVTDNWISSFQKSKSTKKTKTKLGNRKLETVCTAKTSTSIHTDRSSYSNIREENIANDNEEQMVKIEAEEIIPQQFIADDANDLNENVFDIVTAPARNDRREIERNNETPKAFANKQSIFLEEEETECPTQNSINQIENTLDPFVIDDNEESVDWKQENGDDDDSVTVENKIWVGDNDDADEINQTFSDNQESIQSEQNSIDIIGKGVPELMQRKIPKTTLPPRRVRLTKRGKADTKTASDDVDNFDDSEFEMIESDSNNTSISSSSTHVSSKRLKLSDKSKKSGKIDSRREPVNPKDAKVKNGLDGLIEGRDYFKCTKCIYIARKNSNSKPETNEPNQLRKQVAVHYTRHHNPLKPTDKLKTVDGKFCYRCTKCTFSIPCQPKTLSVNTPLLKLSLHYMQSHDKSHFHSGCNRRTEMTKEDAKIEKYIQRCTTRTEITITDTDEIKKALQGLVEGRDYFKCTKCPYFVKKTSFNTWVQNRPKVLHNTVMNHYSVNHNPVKRIDISKTIDGKDCYKCTKCTFLIIFESDNYKLFLGKLSRHYMELHDAFENQTWMSNPDNNVTCPTEGIDYFSCPFDNCIFEVFIKREECQKQQLKNASEARLKIIEHFRLTNVHIKERKEAFSDITEVCKSVDVSFYQCTKCDFKSSVEKSIQDKRRTAQRVLVIHYLREHIFPWEKFPGLYKYGCYQEKGDDGNILKCPYSECDYFTNIQYGLEGKNEEECQLIAYQSFVDHALSHNFNSVSITGIGNDDLISTRQAKTRTKIRNIDRQKLLPFFNREMNDLARLESSDFTSTQFINDASDTEINFQTQTFTDQESIRGGQNSADIIVKPNVSQQLGKELSENELVELDINVEIKLEQPDGLLAYNDGDINSASEDELSDHGVQNISSDRESTISGNDSEFYTKLTKTRGKKRKRDKITKPATIEIERNITSVKVTRTDTDQATTELEGLTEGRDYFKCTKCDYVAKKECIKDLPSKLHKKIVEHYTHEHNPVKTSDKFLMIDGNYSYKCNKCDFSVVFPSRIQSGGHNHYARQKLSKHYMEVHDSLECQSVNESLNVENQDTNFSGELNDPVIVIDQKNIVAQVNNGEISVVERNGLQRKKSESEPRESDISSSRKNELEKIIEGLDLQSVDNNNEKDHFGRRKRPLRSCVLKNLHVSKCEDKISESESEESGSDEDLECDFSSSSAQSECEEEAEDTEPKCRKTTHKFPKRGDCKNKKTELDAPRELPEGLVEGKDFMKCPKCDFFILSSDCNMIITSDKLVKTFLRRKIAAHYGKQHMEIKQRDLSQTSDGKYYYKCKTCDFYTIVRGNRGNSSIDRSIKERIRYHYHDFCLHYVDVHDFGTKGKLPDGLTEGKDFSKCTKCNFFILSSDYKKYYEGNDRLVQRNIRKKLATHYSKHHLPEMDLSKTAEDEDFYKCTKCSFQVIIGDVVNGDSINCRLRTLSFHYMKIHDVFATEETSPKDSNLDKFKNLIETIDYFRCPETTCPFHVMINKANGKNVYNLARLKITNHFNLCHNPELKNILLKPVLDELEGTVCFRCTKCDFKSSLKNEKDQSEARRRMKFHFDRKHTQPWKNFKNLYKLKYKEEKCGDDDVVKCIQPGCDFFVKIDYVEGKSRERCRYIAYNSVRSHATGHDPTKKIFNDKGYSNVYLPLYKGNRTFYLTMKPNRSLVHVDEKNCTTEEIASSNYPLNTNNLKSVSITSKSVKDVVDPVQTICNQSSSVGIKSSETGACDNSFAAISETRLSDDAAFVTLDTSPIGLSSVENLRRSKRTSAIKRKRYEAEDFVMGNDDEEVEASMNEERCNESEDEEESEKQPVAVITSKRNKKCKMHEKSISKLISSDNSFETPEYPTEDHYRCWKCEFYVKVDYNMKNKKNSQTHCRDKAKHKLSIHFNSEHNHEELAFHDPDRLLKVIEGKDCFMCPRCDHFEEIKFNPKKHADKIQGRKNARVNLGRHFFYRHCVPERPDTPNEESVNAELNNDNSVNDVRTMGEKQQQEVTDSNTLLTENLEIALQSSQE